MSIEFDEIYKFIARRINDIESEPITNSIAAIYQKVIDLYDPTKN